MVVVGVDPTWTAERVAVVETGCGPGCSSPQAANARLIKINRGVFFLTTGFRGTRLRQSNLKNTRVITPGFYFAVIAFTRLPAF